MISLAPAANEPAKQFKKDSNVFPEGCLRTRKSILTAFGATAMNEAIFGEDGDWASIRLDSISDELLKNATYEKHFRSFDQRIRSGLETAESLSYADITINRSFNEYSSGTLKHPLALKGWTLRADLDGFSKQVTEAFDHPNRDKALKELVTDFIEVMDDAELFDQKCPFSTIKLPWAGDCASRFIVSTEEAYQDEASATPAQVLLRWQQHTQTGRWLVALAGGDENNGDGNALIAEMMVKGRRFQIAGGWSIRRSKQGEQEIGGKPTESVMHACDVAQLSNEWKHAFNPVDGHPTYSRATRVELEKSQQKTKALLDHKVSMSRRASATRPKPYFTHD